MARAGLRASSTTSQSPTVRKQTITKTTGEQDQQTARAACRAARPGILGQEVLAKSHRRGGIVVFAVEVVNPWSASYTGGLTILEDECGQ